MTTLRKGQTLRPLHAAVAQREWGVSTDAVCAVQCSYRVLIDRSHFADRVDVVFRGGMTVWGAPASEFAVVGEDDDAAH